MAWLEEYNLEELYGKIINNSDLQAKFPKLNTTTMTVTDLITILDELTVLDKAEIQMTDEQHLRLDELIDDKV